MTKHQLVQMALEQGLTFEAFLHRAEQRMHAQGPDDQFASGRHLNWSRMARHQKTYEPSEEMRIAMNSVAGQTWVVITEDWCGDSAQILPVISAIASLSETVRLRILDRDSYPKAMDLYLTNGTRSVPIVIAFNADTNELWHWGPRPEAAKTLVDEWKTRFENKSDMYPLLHAWYAEHGHSEIERDVVQLLHTKG
ncbi:MAG: thioredoxin family protein [Ignavibacteria bacterium]|nr:thioredoxin family protein [Ignavibacteria bacterium]